MKHESDPFPQVASIMMSLEFKFDTADFINTCTRGPRDIKGEETYTDFLSEEKLLVDNAN